MLVHVWLNVQIAEERLLVSQLTAQRQQIERENSEVIFAIANSSTLDRVEEAALQQGFRPATDRVYVRRDAVASDMASSITDAQPTGAPLPATAAWRSQASDAGWNRASSTPSGAGWAQPARGCSKRHDRAGGRRV